MSKKKAVKKDFGKNDIIDIPKKTPFTGLTISRKAVPYIPEILLDKAGAAKSNRPVFMLRPFSPSQRHRLDSDFAIVRGEVSLWAKRKNIDITNFVSVKGITKFPQEYSAYLAAIDEYTDKDLKSEIVRECLGGVKLKGTSKKLKKLKFEADEEGYIKEEIFETYHPDLIDDLFDELYRISNPKWDDTLGK